LYDLVPPSCAEQIPKKDVAGSENAHTLHAERLIPGYLCGQFGHPAFVIASAAKQQPLSKKMQQFSFPYQLSLKSQLSQDAQSLIDAAEAATGKAYAPYSKFKVGAVLQLADGSRIAGANQENAAFPAGICAERAALSQHDMHGNIPITAIAISYQAIGGREDSPLSPCGICRQSILEAQLHQNSPIRVYMAAPDSEVVMVEDASFLLPFHFSGRFL
jgi:cytidine deaminase